MPLLARLRDALSSTYLVERELAQGGCSVVFLARDTTLDRDVAIKVMRPELATARAIERFNREARTLANLNHPNIVPVYTAGEADGLFYFVMPYLRGETLAQRIARQPLSAREATRIGAEILDALAAAHRVGVIHRDVTARNVFLENGRALVADFGLSSAQATAPDGSGSIGSMPPDQFSDGEVSAATDVYAVGALLYFALAGQPWRLTVHQDRDVWAPVPMRLRGVLRHALQWSPAQRYESADAFGRALRRITTQRTLALAGAALLLVVAAGFTVSYFTTRKVVADSDLAILPFAVRGGNARVGRDLATLATLRLESAPELRITPNHFVFRWFDAHREHDYRTLQAKSYVNGTVVQRGDQLTIDLTIFEKSGSPLGTLRVSGSTDSIVQLGDSIALGLLLRTHPRFASRLEAASPVGTRNLGAVLDFLGGEQDFRQGAWLSANDHFRSAVSNDSTFLLAWWRLLNVWRWMPTAVPDPRLDLAGLYSKHGAALSILDRRLIEAQLTDSATQRIQKLQQAANEFPHNGYAALLHGDELFHRGALSGMPIAISLPALEQAVARDSFLTPAQEHLVWAAILTNDSVVARRALDRLSRIAPPPESVDLYTPAFFEHAYTARFRPMTARSALAAFFDTATAQGMSALRLGVRAGLMVGLPQTQQVLARTLLTAPSATRQDHGNAYEAIGLAGFALGQFEQALAAVDSAAAILGTPELMLEAAEWRILGSAIGWPLTSAAELQRARAKLEGLARQPATSARALWVHSLDQLFHADYDGARQTIRHLRTSRDSNVIRLATLSAALLQGRLQNYAAAMRLSSTILRYEAHGRLGDPFARAVLHIERSNWRRRSGDDAAAEAELVWTENQDLVGWPGGPAQSAEVDATYTAFALLRRASLAQRRGDTEAACARVREARYLTQGAALPAPLLRGRLAGLVARCSS